MEEKNIQGVGLVKARYNEMIKRIARFLARKTGLDTELSHAGFESGYYWANRAVYGRLAYGTNRSDIVELLNADAFADAAALACTGCYAHELPLARAEASQWDYCAAHPKPVARLNENSKRRITDEQ